MPTVDLKYPFNLILLDKCLLTLESWLAEQMTNSPLFFTRVYFILGKWPTTLCLIILRSFEDDRRDDASLNELVKITFANIDPWYKKSRCCRK